MRTDRPTLLSALGRFKRGAGSRFAVSAYEGPGSRLYEDAANKSFVYGEITRRFLDGIRLRASDRIVLDAGCGTGFAFDVLTDQFRSRDVLAVGMDAAAGMLALAPRGGLESGRVRYVLGRIEAIPLAQGCVDRIVSTLALHWVPDLEAAATELRRVLKDGGRLDALMIASDDGARFKRAVVRALRKHLSFAQILRAASLVQRVHPDDVRNAFHAFRDFEIEIECSKQVFFGTFEQHFRWWAARSSAVISEVEDETAFLKDLEEELRALATDDGIPFDSSSLSLHIYRRPA